MLITSFLLSVTLLSTFHAYVIDPCSKVKCSKPQIACLDIKFESGTYECTCALNCKEISQQKTVNASASFVNVTNKFDSRLVPIAKQGGPACYQSACMNGGTCFSNFNPVALTTTTTTTTASYTYNTPICSCQAQFSGSRCELYNPSTQVQQDGWNNLCRVYNDRNMNICQNGGQCIYISDAKVACVCPSSFVGQYCELPLYIQCQGAAFSQCHRDFGTCLQDGSCQCREDYTGTRCDTRKQQQFAATVTTTTLAQQGTCLTFYCLNGGTCRSSTVDPYVVCICPVGYTGARCETLVYVLSTIPTVATSTSGTTLVPRCNFTVSLQNDGLYTARFRLQYTIDGIQQPIYVSESLPFIGQRASVTIPFYAKDLIVTGERFGFSWVTTFQDSGINVLTRCTKCYKTWGGVATPSWDHILC